jgi:hypothetical protein
LSGASGRASEQERSAQAASKQAWKGKGKARQGPGCAAHREPASRQARRMPPPQ